MADTFSDNTDAAPLSGNEIIPCVGDPAGTPFDGRFTPADLATYFGTGTAMTGLVLSWDAVDGITVGTGHCYTEGGDTISVATALALTSLSLSSSTWYHVYVYLSGGSPAAEVGTAVPAAWTGTAYSKTGDTSRRYVGSIKTDGSSNIHKFFHAGDDIYYIDTNQTASPFRVLSAGTASTATSVSLSGPTPTTARSVYIGIYDNADQLLRIGATSSVSTTAYIFRAVAGTAAIQAYQLKVPIYSGQAIYYKFDGAVGSGGVTIDVHGYTFIR